MTDPQDFYRRTDEPTRHERHTMWSHISGRISTPRRPGLFTLERRSFFYGMAASVILMFTALGMYTTVRNAVERAQPTAIRIDNAYRTAISEFERVTVRFQPSNGAENTTAELAAARREQMDILDGAIRALREEASSRDVSPMLRARLRDLYSKKLALLQTMVNQGEVEL
jgi:hypothetical protein